VTGFEYATNYRLLVNGLISGRVFYQGEVFLITQAVWYRISLSTSRFREGEEMPQKKGDPSEAGRKGGQVVKERYGTEFYAEIGRKGGEVTKRKYGPEHYAEIGKRGGQTTSERHGRRFYEGIGKKGGTRLRELVDKGKRME
jgi:general stress protein YciG